MWRKPTSRARDVCMGVLVGLAVAGLLVRWHFDNDHDKEILVKRFNEGERSFLI